MHPAPIPLPSYPTASQPAAPSPSCSVRGPLLVAREEEEEEAPTNTPGQHICSPPPTFFINKIKSTYLTVMRYFKPHSLAPAVSISENTAHSSHLPTRPRQQQREGWRAGFSGSVSPRRELARGRWHQPHIPCAAPAGQGEMQWEGTCFPAPPGSVTPCRVQTDSSPPPQPEQGRIRPRGSCQRRFPLPPPPAQLQHGAVGGGNKAAKGIEHGTKPGHK